MFLYLWSAFTIISSFHGICCKNETFNLRIDESKYIRIFEDSSNVIVVSNVPSSATALLFEAHSHTENITLSEKENLCTHCSVTGRNIGMIYKLQSWEQQAHMWLLNNLQENITVLIIISAINTQEPIPGGCNMEFPIEIAPYLKLRNEFGKTYLEFQHASIGSFRDEPPSLCSFSLPYITYEIYVLYLKENDFSQEEYFDKIKDMANLSLLKQNAEKVRSYSLHPDTRFSFLMYPNVGVLYNVIAKYTVNGVVKESCYVPISSYGCGNSELTKLGCNFTYFVENKTFLFLLSMYGFITAFFGYTFFGPTMFFFGFLTAFFITLVLIGRYSNISKSGIIKLSEVVGILGGAVWLAVWFWLHNSVISLLPVGFVFGFLVSAVILYSPVGNYEINLNDKNYWLILAAGSLFITVVLLAYPIVLSILGSSVVGSYCMLLFYDDFINTRLSFIILNIVKRAVSENLEFATNDYPLQVKDFIIYTLWAILSVCAIIFQSRNVHSSSNISQLHFTRFGCCVTKSKIPTTQTTYDLENPHQPLCSDNSVFYNTFPK